MSSSKYCIVPKCYNTSLTTPDKLFFLVPRDERMRNEWSKLMNRNDKSPLPNKSNFYCCEDHFDVEIDMENYLRYQIMGGQRKLKKGTVPHKFACQKNESLLYTPEHQKRQQIEHSEKILSSSLCHENMDCSVRKSIGIQVNLKKKNGSKAMNAYGLWRLMASKQKAKRINKYRLLKFGKSLS